MSEELSASDGADRPEKRKANWGTPVPLADLPSFKTGGPRGHLGPCFSCGQMGHFSRECPKRQGLPGGPPPLGPGRGREGFFAGMLGMDMFPMGPRVPPGAPPDGPRPPPGSPGKKPRPPPGPPPVGLGGGIAEAAALGAGRGPPGGSMGRGGLGMGLAMGMGARGQQTRGDQNDYCQHFVDTGMRPQNFLRDVHLADRYAEYPKLKELVNAKDQLVQQRATPPTYLKADLKEIKLSTALLGTRFDVVLIDPPWEEYSRRAPGLDIDTWTWQEIQALNVGDVTETPSFCFLWCGSAEGLDAGRHCLRRWGFRRCEDVCWIKTNAAPENRARAGRQDAHCLLQHTKEHCLMGVKGSVRRAQDSHLIHANVDTDILVAEEFPHGSTRKPDEIYAVIERFSLGRRRLELFGEDHNIRPGWLTLGRDLTSSNFSPQVYASHFLSPEGQPPPQGRAQPGAPHLLGTTEEIENLRPRSPPH